SVLSAPPTRYVDFRGGQGHTIPQRPGDVVFRPAGVVTRAAWDGTVETINVALSPDIVTSVGAQMLDGRTVEVAESHFGADARVWHLAHALLHELSAGSSTGLFVDSVRTALAAHVVAAYGRVSPTSTPALSGDELQRVRDRVEAELASPLRLADLASAVPLSPYHFSRAFKAATGITPHEFVVRRRVEAAKVLLQRGKLPVAEVARRTGFTDASHLARQFRRRVGMSPARYAAAMSPRRASSV
ncbi:MAG TPA: AraC family transcriptional regulator, partial [Mycobacterium sp.]|nr:AraC family transcriptional regulator [Mycobacterium sp.]